MKVEWMTSSNDSRQIIDQVALAVRDDSSAEAAALYRTWEAWGIWANGGFEAILTGGVADELAGVVAALREVGAGAMADLFDAAAAMLPEQVLGSYEARSEFACGPRGEVVLAAWRNLTARCRPCLTFTITSGRTSPVIETFLFWATSECERGLSRAGRGRRRWSTTWDSSSALPVPEPRARGSNGLGPGRPVLSSLTSAEAGGGGALASRRPPGAGFAGALDLGRSVDGRRVRRKVTGASAKVVRGKPAAAR